VRYFGWVDHVLKLVRRADLITLQQVLRIIINISFDEHCRYMLQKADAPTVINAAASQAKDTNISSLTSTAIKNLNAPVPAAVRTEVDNKLSSGGVENISAPRAAQKVNSDIDLKGLDAVLDSYGGGASRKPAAQYNASPSAQYKPAAQSNASSTQYKPATQSYTPPSTQYKPAAKSYAPPSTQYKPVDGVDDLDDLLDAYTNKPEPAKPSYTPSKPSNQSPHVDYGYNDLDDGPSDYQPNYNRTPVTTRANDLDDIDDLLNDLIG